MSFSIKPSSFRTVNLSSRNISVSGKLDAGVVDTRVISPEGGGQRLLVNGPLTAAGEFNVLNSANVFGEFSVQGGYLYMKGTSDPAMEIATPEAGMLAYNTTNNTLLLYNGSSWLTVTAAP